jgi:hypothetical protein
VVEWSRCETSRAPAAAAAATAVLDVLLWCRVEIMMVGVTVIQVEVVKLIELH